MENSVIFVLFDVTEVGAESNRRCHRWRYCYRIGVQAAGLLMCVLTVQSSQALTTGQIAGVGARVNEQDVLLVLIVDVDVATSALVVFDVDVDGPIGEDLPHLEILSRPL